MRRLIIIACLCLSFANIAQAQDLLGRINELRAERGLVPYSASGILASAANNQAQWMVSTGQISHTQSDGSSPRSRAAAAGYPSQWVSENIYMGGGAGWGNAWTFWVNSPIHYAGLTSPNYSEVGIGVATGDYGTAYVLVFGAPSTPNYNAPSGASSNSAGAGQSPARRSFVVGVDGSGNIMHEVQAGETLGDIALQYGYEWDDIPTMLSINGLTQADIRLLKTGSVFLVPPYDGTFTPTPTPTLDPAQIPTETPTPEPSATPIPSDTSEPLPAPALFNAAQTPTPAPSNSPAPTFTASPTSSPTEGMSIRVLPTQVAALSTPALRLDSASTPSNPASVTETGAPLWLWALIGVQALIFGYAGIELFRRRGR
jgi:hypothetical protein